MKYCIQGPFAEIVTAVIKAWRFLEGASSPLAKKKKGEAEAGALYALRCEVFLEDVSQKGDAYIPRKTQAQRLAFMAN